VQKRLPEAEELLQRALSKSPDLPLALTNLGYLFVDSGRAAQAVPFFQRARKAATGDENAAYGLALALEASGDRAGAAGAWRQFLAAFPSSAWAPRARQRLEALTGR
jgi:tetratricopeptide (TPR) repeat protein